ncbi:MAG TPA: TolC family protein [Candidatus Acidoferrum sp.]|jgi:outer membrane protein TolC
MTSFGVTAMRSIKNLTANTPRQRARKSVAQAARSILAAVLTVILIGAPASPAFAQQPQYQPPPAPTSQPTPTNTQETTTPPIPVSLGVSKYHYDNSPRVFPNLIAPYIPTSIPPVSLTNSPRLDQLVHDNKLEITLQDAVELALENSLDIAVARYNPWTADTNILRAKGGGQPLGTSGAEIGQSQANIPFLNLDPILTANTSVSTNTTPINNPFISGTGAASASGLESHSTIFDAQYTEGFTSGTTVTAAWSNTRSSSSSAVNFFNPAIQSSLTITASQQLLNGFGFFANRRNILISQNNRKLADFVFAQQAITTVTSAITAYWELVFARENVKVQQQATTVSEKLYNDNKKQLEIGTMAPLDVTRAESELATDKQNLIVAQTTKLQDEQVLKNAISKDPLAPNMINVEIIPTELPTVPPTIEAASFEDAIREAFAKRPELQQQAINVMNADVEVRATKNALLPLLSLTAQYSSQGLAGNSAILGPGTTVSSGVPIVDANGNPISVNGVPVFQSTTNTPVIGSQQQGFTTAQSQIFHNNFPSYSAGLNLQLPIRNRTAQADNIRAILTERQIATQLQQMKNAALLDVRNTYIALQQDRARVEAASEARKLQQETFDAEQKKYQLGASTVYNVILTQRDLISAQGTELRALADLVEAKANYDRAVGRTLEVNRVTIANSRTGEFERDTLIPGTLHGQVVGTLPAASAAPPTAPSTEGHR